MKLKYGKTAPGQEVSDAYINFTCVYYSHDTRLATTI